MSTSDVLSELLREEEEHLQKLAACRADIAALRGDALGADPVRAETWLGEDLGSFQWLINGLLPKEGVAVMASDSTLGKTSLIAQMTICLSRGISFLGYTIETPQPTLTVAAEGSRLAFRNRFETACRSLRVGVDGLSWYIQPEDLSDYMIGSAGLEAMVAKSKAKLVVLDTIGYFHKGDENDANDWKRNVMQPLRGLIRKYGCTFLLVHHHAKGGDRHGWQKGRGTTAMFADCDLWLRLEKADTGGDSARDLHIDKNKYGRMDYYEALNFRQANAVFEMR